jgi:molybdate transport system substrate-binding protein
MVSLGEADASVVYVTDVKSEKSVSGVRIPDAQNIVATYPIATVKESQNTAAARAWVRFVQSKAGQNTLKKFGFLRP